jgi:16S rRNA (cytidine1402-2'-O)-methyltransferase
MSPSGILYIVATPIGHLEDISLRALSILKSVHAIYAEDTRHSHRLLSHYLIQTPVKSLHQHNERAQIQEILSRLKAGENLALISDAGTPLISDPGFPLVHAARSAGLTIAPIPGACAAIAALSASGLATDAFIFQGFLPAKREAKRKILEQFQHEKKVIIFYESCHRIIETLEDMLTVFGNDRKVAFARELTKQFETLHVASLREMMTFVTGDQHQQKGEIVLILDKAEENTDISPEIITLLQTLCEELPLNQACKIAARLTGKKKNQLYTLAMAFRKEST